MRSSDVMFVSIRLVPLLTGLMFDDGPSLLDVVGGEDWNELDGAGLSINLYSSPKAKRVSFKPFLMEQVNTESKLRGDAILKPS